MAQIVNNDFVGPDGTVSTEEILLNGTSAAINTSTADGDAFTINGYRTATSSYKTFVTVTAGSLPTFAMNRPLDSNFTITGAVLSGGSWSSGSISSCALSSITLDGVSFGLTGGFGLTFNTTATSVATIPAGTTTLVPTTGTGATGTWNISISGSAGAADASTLTGTTLASNVVNSSLTNFGTVSNITMADTGAIRTTTTSGQSVYFSAYDNDGASYIPMMYMTAGNTPALVISNGVGAGTLSITGATIGALSMTMGTGGFITLGTGDAVRTTTTVGETWLMQAYDTNDAVYRTFGTFTAGTTPSMALSAPSGGSATIDNISIGATTAATGRFSTLATTSTSSLAGDVTMATGTAIKSATSAGNTMLLQAYDVNGAVYRTFATFTANNTPTLDISAPAGGSGTIDNMVIGSVTPTTGSFTNLSGTSATISNSASGSTVTTTNTNSSNTANSHSTFLASVAGTSSGDPSLLLSVSGTTQFSMGIDNSDSDKLKEQFSASVGTSSTRIVTTAGEQTMPLQPAFSANKASNTNNQTGDGTVYTIICDTEIYDQNGDYDNTTGIFTAPVTGRYHFCFGVGIFGLAAGNTQGYMELVTSNKTYRLPELNVGAVRNASNSLSLNGAVYADMDAADTASIVVSVSGGTLVVDIDGGAVPTRTYFSGALIC